MVKFRINEGRRGDVFSEPKFGLGGGKIYRRRYIKQLVYRANSAMFRRLCAAGHRQLQVTATLGHRRAAASRPHFLPFPKPYSLSSDVADESSSLIASSLARSCGISDHAALSISKKVRLGGLGKALSVLAILKDYGFDELHFVRLVKRYPPVLSMNVGKTLKPKLEFYRGIGIVGTAFPGIVSKNPQMLTCRVENRLLPNAVLLKSILKTDANLVNALKRGPWLMTYDTRTIVLPKVDALRAYGVPDDVMLVMFIRSGYALLKDAARFNEAFDEIKKMGMCPKKTTFAHALGVLAALPKKRWEEKMENFKGLGWSQDLIKEAFARYPKNWWSSTEKVRMAVKFFEEKLGWTPEITAKSPILISMSLEKRMIPRHAVLSILMHKGLIKTGFKANYFMISSKNFHMKFVTEYQDKAPEIVEAYQRSEMG